MTTPRIYVVERSALKAWGSPSSFNLTFEETMRFIHDLQDAMFDQKHLSEKAEVDFFILVNPQKEVE